MFCTRCGEITKEKRCIKCGGWSVPSTTGAEAIDGGRKDPWTSTYLQRRLNPANSHGRPLSTYTPNEADDIRGGIRTGDMRGGALKAGAREDYGAAGWGRVRDATGTRPSSMYAGGAVLDGPVQSAIERTVAPKGSSGQLRNSPRDRGSGQPRWSQYFTSSANPKDAITQAQSPRHSELLAAAEKAAEKATQAQQAFGEKPAGARKRADSGNVRVVTSAFDTRRRRVPAGTSSPLSPAIDVRSRSATLPEPHGTGSRACTSCGVQVRSEEQRQFASQPHAVYCAPCYHSSYSRGHCAGCGKIVLTHGRPWVQSGSDVWHKLCIKCSGCSKMLLDPLVGLDGRPTCEQCFMSKHPQHTPRPMPATASPKPRAQTVTSQPKPSSMLGAQSIPTPVLTDRAPSSEPTSSSALHGSDMEQRIMSPVEVAAKEGLPLPRHIVDPDSDAASRPESHALSSSRSHQDMRVDTTTVPLSPALKTPNSPRTSSPRSVSFKIDEPPSLADYVLSKVSSSRASANAPPSVADTIRKFGGLGLNHNGSAAKRRTESTDSSQQKQMPELRDLLRTHQKEPPTEPTVPQLDKHSKLLKSRPRNQNRRRPTSQTQVNQQQPIAEPQQVPKEDMEPNQCARCSVAISDTWFRLSDGRQVHVECFTCQGCQQLIDDGVYVVEGLQEFHPHCVPPSPPIVAVEPAARSTTSSQLSIPATKPRGPRDQRREELCHRCHTTLSGPRFQLTNGKSYHPECFACAGCKQRFDEGSYVCFDGQEYHHQCVENIAVQQPQTGDHLDMLVCSECSRVIEGVFLRHNDFVFHPACFCCLDCHTAITPGMPFGEIDSKPCCESCLEARAQQQQQQQGEWIANSYYPAKASY
ncbi:LIM and senescent cell antigen-like-containing domain protein 2 [Coemansia brasiliensis]|uniref:LIM and senescent cell antigen-like-containing domain protein 2 n=1 Tax=Coemansia brasiliensis TaxID=2650707 RepID=A0A9W8M197_9FUNG|nr:LIM and senescent cell antigen-like-containing domain protein 2 [Coemansia brasiliensis]